MKTRSKHAVARRFNDYVKDKDAYYPLKKYWTADEIQKFADAVREFGDNRMKISEFMGSKSEK